MTLERPMFPPCADECLVFDFASYALAAKILKEVPDERSVRKARMKERRDERAARRAAGLREVTTAPEKFSPSVRNHRMRQSRRDAWRTAEGLTNFARARMDWHSSLQTAQSWNVAGSNEYPNFQDSQDRIGLVDRWRDALVKQMLTPAPDQAAVNWKRVQMRGGQYRYVGVKAEKLQRAIDADVEWLIAHPARKSVPMSDERKEERRKFKEAMRQRIREVGAARSIPDDEIRPVLSLRHHLIAEFSENYNVSLDWLLEGEGRIFKKDPIRLSPNMTGSEFAAVVTTLPVADQQAISTTVREILQERDL
jgi:hypothetical protein